MKIIAVLLLCSNIAFVGASYSQSISLPPKGDNQKCSVTQWIGLVSVTIIYNSPNVTGSNGVSRKGNIWGGVVPYGLVENNFGTADEIPWRAGANENTTISFSHDVKVEGKEIIAGTYGLHMIPEATKWIIIFSKNSNAWGSYFYNSRDDALRVEVKPQNHPFTEWLTFDFIEKRPTFTVAALKWEELLVSFKIEADVIGAYVNQIRTELQGSPGLSWQNWIAAVDFCIDNSTNLNEAVLWVEYAINAPFVGECNFTTLSSKARLMLTFGKDQEANQLIEEAINQPTATMVKTHELGKELLNDGRKKSAILVFELNRQKFPEENFITSIGLAIANKALGKTKQAIRHYRLAAENAPHDQRDYYLGLVKELEKR